MTDTGDWKRFDGADYTDFLAGLLREKGGDAQREFLEQVKANKEFVERMDKIKKSVGQKEENRLEKPFSEGQFKNPPVNTEEQIYRNYENLTPAIACKPSFWAFVTLGYIRENMIQSSYLAADAVNGDSGEMMIDKALVKAGDEGTQQMDKCVRNVLRQLGGLPQARGNRSVFVDCPLARAWWRQRLLLRASKRCEKTPEELGRSIRKTKLHWEKFVATMVSRNPVLGMAHVQDALLVSLWPLFADTEKVTASHIQSICQNLCIITGSRELGILDFCEVLQDCNASVASVSNSE